MHRGYGRCGAGTKHALANAKRHQRELARRKLEHTIWEFNAQEYSARKAQIDRYFEINKKKNRSKGGLNLLESIVPSGAKIERRTMLLSLRD